MIGSRKPQWRFYAAWIVLQTLCVPIAFVLYIVIIRVIIAVIGDYVYVGGVRHITEDYLLVYVFIPLIAMLMAFVQFGLLRLYLPRLGWWAPLTVAGWFVGLILIFALRGAVTYFSSSEAYYETSYLDLNLILLGLSIGTIQWLLLRNRLPQAGWWIAANFAGWGLVAFFSGDALGQFGLIALGLLPASATAAALALLFNQALPSEPTPEDARLV